MENWNITTFTDIAVEYNKHCHNAWNKKSATKKKRYLHVTVLKHHHKTEQNKRLSLSFNFFVFVS